MVALDQLILAMKKSRVWESEGKNRENLCLTEKGNDWEKALYYHSNTSLPLQPNTRLFNDNKNGPFMVISLPYFIIIHYEIFYYLIFYYQTALLTKSMTLYTK